MNVQIGSIIYALYVNHSVLLKVSGTESEEQSMSSDETKTNIQNSFGDNFVDKNLTDKDLNSDVDGNVDESSSSFEPMNDSKEYIGKYHIS